VNFIDDKSPGTCLEQKVRKSASRLAIGENLISGEGDAVDLTSPLYSAIASSGKSVLSNNSRRHCRTEVRLVVRMRVL